VVVVGGGRCGGWRRLEVWYEYTLTLLKDSRKPMNLMHHLQNHNTGMIMFANTPEVMQMFKGWQVCV